MKKGVILLLTIFLFLVNVTPSFALITELDSTLPLPKTTKSCFLHFNGHASSISVIGKEFVIYFEPADLTATNSYTYSGYSSYPTIQLTFNSNAKRYYRTTTWNEITNPSQTFNLYFNNLLFNSYDGFESNCSITSLSAFNITYSNSTKPYGLTTNSPKSFVIGDTLVPIFDDTVSPVISTTFTNPYYCNYLSCVVPLGATVSDNYSSGLALTYNPVLNFSFPIGTTSQSLYAIDNSGNATTSIFDVIVATPTPTPTTTPEPTPTPSGTVSIDLTTTNSLISTILRIVNNLQAFFYALAVLITLLLVLWYVRYLVNIFIF